MSFDFDAPNDVGGSGKFLSEPGTYHFTVLAIHDGTLSDGKPMKGGGFTAGLAVLTGTVDGQKEKEINLAFFNGKLDAKDQGEFARKKQAAFLIATGLLAPSDLGKKGLKIDLQDAVNRQLIATLEVDESSEKKYLQLSYANVYHIDDPRAKNFPRSVEAVSLVPKEQRKPAEYFASLDAKKAKDNGFAAPARPALSQTALDNL